MLGLTLLWCCWEQHDEKNAVSPMLYLHCLWSSLHLPADSSSTTSNQLCTSFTTTTSQQRQNLAHILSWSYRLIRSRTCYWEELNVISCHSQSKSSHGCNKGSSKGLLVVSSRSFLLVGNPYSIGSLQARIWIVTHSSAAAKLFVQDPRHIWTRPDLRDMPLASHDQHFMCRRSSKKRRSSRRLRLMRQGLRTPYYLAFKMRVQEFKILVLLAQIKLQIAHQMARAQAASIAEI